MPRDPLFPDASDHVRPRSPDTMGGNDRKRRRKVLSCYDCRRRKLQCDRAQPACGRCTKAGMAAHCLYIDEPVNTPTRNSESVQAPAHANADAAFPRTTQAHPADSLSRLEFQERRIRELETALSASHQSPSHPTKSHRFPLTPESIVEMSTSGLNVTDRETMLLRGKSFKTQFHGISHPGSQIAYIPELSAFTVEAIEKYPGLARMKQDMHALEDRSECPDLSFKVRTTTDLKALLPSKTEADMLVNMYLDNYDNIYHILHVPSFLREYGEMWDHMPTARVNFVALVLLMIATARCLPSTEPLVYVVNSSSARDMALVSIRACEDWLLTQSQKHVTITDFQVRFLVNLSKIANAYKFKRTWTDAGTFLRFCMAAGLHRNPDSLRKPTSAMDKEMRRRIWLAVAELELGTAFARGMISAPWPQQSDYVAPTNLHDEDMEANTIHLPAPRSTSEFTNASYLALANESFMLRYTLNNVLNNVRQAISFDEAKLFTEETEALLQAIPQWNEAASEAPHALLSITLRNYMLVLHDRQIRQTSSPSERTFSKMVILEAAKKIVEIQKALADKGNRVLLLLCHDQMRAALSVCHVFTLSDPAADTLMHELTESCAIEVVSGVVDLIAKKIGRLGCEQRQLWIVVAAHAFMKTKKDASQKFVYMQEAVDKVLRQFYKILAGQKEILATGSAGGVDGFSTQTTQNVEKGIAEYFPLADGAATSKPELGGINHDPALLDFDAVAAWTFDDWTFNPSDFAAFDAGA